MTASSPSQRLTPLQRELLEEFFARERHFVLTGGAALAGFYLDHRGTEDLDLFARPGVDLDSAVRALDDAASASGAVLESIEKHPDFRRLLARRGEERCLVDLGIDRAPVIDPPTDLGVVRIDTMREIAANKVAALLGRGELKDLVDLQRLAGEGVDLRQAVRDATKKDAGIDPATLLWVLGDLRIAPASGLVEADELGRLTRFREEFSALLRALAYEWATGNPG